MTTRRRILKDFSITELAAVDRPAVEGATVALLKRHDTDKETTMHAEGYDTFEQAVAAIAKAENIPQHLAMSKAREAYPDLLKVYQRAGDEQIAKAAADVAPRTDPAITAFNAAVDEAVHQYGCSRSDAMRHVARARPDLLAAYQAVDPRVPSGRGPLT